MEVMDGTHHLPITESSQVGDARRRVLRLAEGLGLGETAAGRAALVTTELAGNLVKHAARGGELLLRRLERDGITGVEILALDRGPGIEDVPTAMRDGYSTAGSPGTGLGAVARMSDLFQLHSHPEAGTAVLAQVWARPLADAGERDLWAGAVSTSKAGQPVGGDGWADVRHAGGTRVVVVDGLGHGSGAAEATAAALASFHAAGGGPPAEILERMHGALRSTRGAAVAIAEIDLVQRVVRYAGVGNIAGLILAGGESRSLVSHNGIVGHEMRRVQEFSYPWTPEATLVMHSDGLQSRWDLARYPGLAVRHPSLIAGVLFRDFQRGNDDATVVAVRAVIGPRFEAAGER